MISYYSNGSDSPHRRGVTSLLRAVGCVRRAPRLDASVVQRVSGTCFPLKFPVHLGNRGPIIAIIHFTVLSGPTDVCPKRHIDRFSRFSNSHRRGQHTETPTDRPRCNVGRKRSYLALPVVMRAKTHRFELETWTGLVGGVA